MSKILGEIRQIAFIVTDIDEAMRYWSDVLGIGPFFIKRKITFSHYIYRGKASASPVVSIALANSGFLQIELIQQHDDVPSIYKEHFDAGQKSMQHASSWFTTEALKAKKIELLDKGYEIAQECVIPSSGVQLIYFSTEKGPSSFIFEIADLKEPVHYKRISNIRQSHDDWDGHFIVNETTT